MKLRGLENFHHLLISLKGKVPVLTMADRGLCDMPALPLPLHLIYCCPTPLSAKPRWLPRFSCMCLRSWP